MTIEHLTEIPIVFYRTSGGVEPVGLVGFAGDDGKDGFGPSPPCRLVGRWVCRCAARLGAGYGKCAAACQSGRYRPSTVLSARRTDWRCARLYQEDTENAAG